MTLLLLITTVAATAILLTAFLPTELMLWALAATCLCQFFSVEIGGIYPSLGLLAGLSLWPALLRRSGIWRWRWMWALLAILIVQAISVVWSPDRMLAMRNLIYSFPGLFAAIAMYEYVSRKPTNAEGLLVLVVVLGLLQAVLVILFRVAPGVEDAFLHHRIANVFVQPNSLRGLFDGTGRNNVLDPQKAGGLFINANVGSIFPGITSILAASLARTRKSRWLYMVALVEMVSVFFSGSKAGIMLAMMSLGVLFSCWYGIRAKFSPGLVALGLVVLAGLVAMVVMIDWQNVDAFSRESLYTLQSRQIMWHFAWQQMQLHPLTGLGSGGWEKLFFTYSFNNGYPYLPAHNSLMMAWSECGLPGLVATVTYVVLVVRSLVQVVRLSDRELKGMAMAFLVAFLWYSLHAMGENFTLVREIHLAPLIGLMLGYLFGRHDLHLQHIRATRLDSGVANKNRVG